MKMLKDIIWDTDFESVANEIAIHYDKSKIPKVKKVYEELLNTPIKINKDNMILFIRAIKENDAGDEDIVVEDFENNDTTLMFDVCGTDNLYDGLYSIAASEYADLMGFFVDENTLNKFTSAQIIAHIIWELYW